MIKHNYIDDINPQGIDSSSVRTAHGVSQTAVYGDITLPYMGIIYRHWVNKPGAEHHGQSYVGETPDEKTRLQCWNKPVNRNYAGKKLVEARKLYPINCWKYEVLEKVYAATEDELEKLLYERETFYIDKYDSYEHGFNGNRGGRGNKGVKFDEVRCKQNGDNRRGKQQPRDSVERGAAKRRGKRQSAETCKKKSEAMTGKKHTPKMNANQSARMKGKEPQKASEAARIWQKNNPGGWWGNHPIPDDVKAKMKSAQQARGTRVKLTRTDGTFECFPTMVDAGVPFNLGAGSISNFLKTGNVSKKADGRFERISEKEYREWMDAQNKN